MIVRTIISNNMQIKHWQIIACNVRYNYIISKENLNEYFNKNDCLKFGNDKEL